MIYHFKASEIPRVISFGPTGISPVNIGGTTILSGLGIKPGTALLSLNDNFKAALRNRLSEVNILIIDELSMVLNEVIYGQILTKGREKYLLLFLK